jgi:O-antigen/teichoic acid export membrane protein
MDVVMLKGLTVNNLEADQYAKAYRLLDAANMLAMLLSGMLLPLFSKLIADKKDLSGIIRVASKVLILPAIPVVVALGLQSEYVMQLMYPLKYQASLDPTFVYITLSFFGYALVYIYGTLLTAKADLKFLNSAAAATALMNIGLNLLLIPEYGALGAAKATLVSQSIFAILCYWRASNEFSFKINKSELLRYFVAVGVSVALIFGLKQLIHQPLVHILTSVASSFIIYLIAKIFRPSELFQLLKS